MKKANRIISFSLCLVLILSVFTCSGVNIFAATGQTVKLMVPGNYQQTQARKMLGMINSFRKGSDAWYWNSDNKTKARATGLSQLKYDYELERVAMQRAAEIALYFEHTRPNGDSCFTAFPTSKYYAMGENIAWGYGMLTTAEEAYYAFREDNEKFEGQGHRRNMLNYSFSAVGCACFIYGKTYYWVQEFGSPVVDTKTVTANDGFSTPTVEILTSRISAAAMSLTTTSVDLTAGDTVGMSPAILLITIPGRDISQNCYVLANPSYTSNNKSIATVSATMVTGVSKGNTTLTASFPIGNINLTGSVDVNVACRHSYRIEVTKNATHKQRGKQTKTCTKCGYSFDEEIPKISYYPDVHDTEWYFDFVDECTELGFMSGYSNGNFGPRDNLQRQDFVCILARIKNADLSEYGYTSDKLSDIKEGKYYTAAVNWAVENGIVSGYENGKFGIGDPITREQVCTILYRCALSPDVRNVDSTLNSHSDYKNVSAFAKIPVAWALQNGVISGMADGRIAPTHFASRAQIATIITSVAKSGIL